MTTLPTWCQWCGADKADSRGRFRTCSKPCEYALAADEQLARAKERRRAVSQDGRCVVCGTAAACTCMVTIQQEEGTAHGIQLES